MLLFGTEESAPDGLGAKAVKPEPAEAERRFAELPMVMGRETPNEQLRIPGVVVAAHITAT